MATTTTTASSRMRALQGLAAPAANQAVAQGIQAAQRVQLQRAVAAAPEGGLGIREAQQAAGAASQAAGQAQLQADAAQTEQVGRVGQLQLAETQRADAERLAGQQVAAQRAGTEADTQLSETARRIKSEFTDAEASLQRDRMGNEVLTERNLADWAATKSKSEEEFRQYAQTIELAHERKQKLNQVRRQLILDRLQLESDKRVQDRDQKLTQALQEEAQRIQNQMAADAAEAANRGARNGAIGQVAGTAIGALGGPAGAALGGALGKGVGTAGGEAVSGMFG